MLFSSSFIYAGAERCTYESFVASPYFRKSFELELLPDSCTITITGLGFYRLWINGKEITKGYLAPYISNPDDIVYYDCYDLLPYIARGENVIGIQLGNGMQNCPGGVIWDLDSARFTASVRTAFAIEYALGDSKTVIEADTSVKTHPSPVYFDDLRSGCRYDATRELPGWSSPDYDDSTWANALLCEKPRGEFRLCEADCILPTGEVIKPVSVHYGREVKYRPRSDVYNYNTPESCFSHEGYIFDFGVNKTGHCRLKINGKKGQIIELQYAEALDKNGDLYYNNINFFPKGFSQRDVYICKGEKAECFEPCFTYHGFRYCLVTGIQEEQLKDISLEYIVYNSAFKERGSFCCSDETANALQTMCRNSDLANFLYINTDCPHREKNGWTGDAAFSAEHILMNLTPEKSYIEWLRNIRKAQREDGSLPGIIPTGGWGYHWGNGPAWDAVLTYLPYYTHIYTGNTEILTENADSIFRYLNYIERKRTDRGTLEFGLGDWLPVRGRMKAPLEVTDTITCISIAQKAAYIFDVLGLKLQKAFADSLHMELRAAARAHLIDLSTKTVLGRCQTSQAMALYFDVFDEGEKAQAFSVLLDIIKENDDFIDFGCQGARYLFHVLSDFSHSELAYKMICRREWPSYGNFVERGLTALPEDFRSSEEELISLNHHFLGDISNWFISNIAGLKYNPTHHDDKALMIKPSFIERLSFASAHFDSRYGRITVNWEKADSSATIKVEFPNEIKAELIVPKGWKIADKETHYCKLESGKAIKLLR